MHARHDAQIAFPHFYCEPELLAHNVALLRVYPPEYGHAVAAAHLSHPLSVAPELRGDLCAGEG